MFKNKKRKISERKYLSCKSYAKYYWVFTVLGGIILILGGINILHMLLNKTLDDKLFFQLLIVPILFIVGGIGLITYAIYNKLNFKNIEEKYLEQLKKKD